MALETLIFSDSQVKVNGAPASSTTTTISGSDQFTMSFNLDLKPTDVVFEARLLFCKNSATNPGALGGFTMDSLSQTMYGGGITDWASVGWSSLQGAVANMVSMLSTSIGGGAGSSWAANLSLNLVMGFPVSAVSFAVDMLRYYAWISEEEKERRKRRKAVLALSW